MLIFIVIPDDCNLLICLFTFYTKQACRVTCCFLPYDPEQVLVKLPAVFVEKKCSVEINTSPMKKKRIMLVK